MSESEEEDIIALHQKIEALRQEKAALKSEKESSSPSAKRLKVGTESTTIIGDIEKHF